MGDVISMIGYMLIGAAAAIAAILALTSWFGGFTAEATQAAIYCGIAGTMLALMGSMMKTRESDRTMQAPPVLSQPGGYQNPTPGGYVPGNPNAGWRPNPGQVPPYAGGPVPPLDPLFPPYATPPGYSPGLTSGGGSGQSFQGTVSLQGTIGGVVASAGGAAGSKGSLKVEQGNVQVVAR